MSKKIVFRVIGGGKHGSGHVYRMVVLATELLNRNRSLNIEFWVEGSVSTLNWIRNSSFTWKYIGHFCPLDREWAFVKSVDSSLFIIDVLRFSAERLGIYTNSKSPVVLFSDITRNQANCNLLVLSQSLSRIRTESNNTLLGPDYFIVKPDFTKSRNSPKSIPKIAKNLLISLGGVATKPGLDSLSRLIPSIAKNWEKVVWIKGRTRLPKYQAPLSLPPSVDVLDFTDEFPNYLVQADVAIISGGFTKFESACCGTPSIILAQHNHEETLGLEFSKTGASLYFGHIKEIDHGEFCTGLHKLQNSHSKRHIMSNRGQLLVDGFGLNRVISAIQDYLPK